MPLTRLGHPCLMQFCLSLVTSLELVGVLNSICDGPGDSLTFILLIKEKIHVANRLEVDNSSLKTVIHKLVVQSDLVAASVISKTPEARAETLRIGDKLFPKQKLQLPVYFCYSLGPQSFSAPHWGT